MSALVYGGRSPIALELCKQLAGAGHEVHLVTRVLDDAITKLAKENDVEIKK
jgi:NAD(P)-dependent dehydrogenase (short-subunit alcohol dehydrogenase family)